MLPARASSSWLEFGESAYDLNLSDYEESENPSRPYQPLQSLNQLAHECFFASPNSRHAMTAAIHHEGLISLLQPLN